MHAAPRASVPLPWVRIDRNLGISAERQICGALRQAIRQGLLPRGFRLPAVRQLANDLDVSRRVIVNAYERLEAEGYVVSNHGGGTHVASAAVLPRRTSACIAPSLRAGTMPPADCAAGSSLALRELIAMQLCPSRGIFATAEEIVLANHREEAIACAARLLADPGARGSYPPMALQSHIFGTVRATDGSVLPGVTVTLTGVGAPQTFVTDEQGNFRFLNLSPGTYTIKSELAGFGVTTRAGVSVSIGRNAQVDVELNPAVIDAITITAEAPLLDTRKAGTGATMTKLELQGIPTGRDPWVVLQQAPGVQMDRINIGGNGSGQQSNYVSKGTNSTQATWNVDGVNITDVGALGSSPTYYDFDAFDEMQVTTGGTDVRIQTAGVQLNMVTKRGTNDFSGSGRFLHTSGDLQADPKVPEEAVSYLARLNEINKVDDYGVEAGGPIIHDRLWLWGAYSK